MSKMGLALIEPNTVSLMRREQAPDFVGIDATRAGSSWLYSVLTHHPQVWMSPVKELHYFDRPLVGKRTLLADPYRGRLRLGSYAVGNWNRNQDGLIENLKWDFRYFLVPRSDRWYKSLFQDAVDEQITGEVTPAYAIIDRERIERMLALNQNLKAIYLLRNPIEQAWSSIVNGLAKKRKRSIHEVSLDEMFAKIDQPGFLERSNYGENIERWRSVLGDDQLLVAFFEEIRSNPGQLITDVCDFLGIDGIDAFPETASELWKKPRNASKKFSAPMPPEVGSYIAKRLYPMIIEMQKQLGARAESWRQHADALLRDS